MGMFKRSLFALVAVLATLSVLTQPAGAVTNGERTAETYLFSLVNNDRHAAHIGTLKEQSYVRGQTENHSTDMMYRHSMDHNGFSQRVANIRAHVAGMKYSGMCENVAAASSYHDYGAAMRAIEAAWRASSDHHKCLYDQLGWSSQSAGIGVRFDGRTYWVTLIAGHNTSP
jgi:uncharacterized protein YkwD